MGAGCCKASFFNYDAECFFREFNQRYDAACAQLPHEAKSTPLLTRIKTEMLSKPSSEQPLLLDFTGTPFNLIGMTALASTLKTNPPVRSLCLSQTSITDNLLGILLGALPSTQSLHQLDLSGNQIGPAGFAAVSQALMHETHITSLSLGHNPGRGDGVSALSNAISSNPPLHTLDISCVAAGDTGAFNLSSALAENTHLRGLDISENQIGLEGGQQLQVVLQRNYTLTYLGLDTNPIQGKHVQQIRESVRRNAAVMGVLDGILDGFWKRISEGNLFNDQTGALPTSRLVWLQPNEALATHPLPSFVGPVQMPLLIPFLPERQVPKERQLRVGYAETRGRRVTMEDAIVIKRNFRGRPDEDFFAIFDGHGGRDAADFAAENLPIILAQHLNAGQAPAEALTETFKECNYQMSKFAINDGTTAAVALFTKDHLFTANAAVFACCPFVLPRIQRERNTIAFKYHIRFDHKADVHEEERRINALGGYVTDQRVLGSLAVSRALGDFSLHPYVTPIPFISLTDYTCDGVWDVLSDETACAIVASDTDPMQSSLRLIEQALLNGSTDNVTVIVVQFC
ncbi:putative protein phosphatase 2C [Paratrimastix pyriformis]|uniref:PPM-type phosphatase domain-containing protein n=1 Tax=Paratrimastix pyriformis TaxID=342808 RepID=A0ABQ8UI65_9EUKA|nr:putative protein phosphatase 2C [Paratrimastix pyriformis]